MQKCPKYIPLRQGELGQLIAFSAESGEPITGALPGNRLIASEVGEKTMRKLAEIRSAKPSS